jgi:hypothetical protein
VPTIQRVGVYFTPRNVEIAALAEGCRAAGFRTIKRSFSDYAPGQVEDFDMVVLPGIRRKGAAIIADYRARGVPCLVSDYGFINRVSDDPVTWESGHWQIGVGQLNHIPPFACPPDRFERLRVDVMDNRTRPGCTLVCGSRPGSGFAFTNPAELQQWAEDLVSRIGSMDEKPEGEILWRDHPRAPRIVPRGFDGVANGPLHKVMSKTALVIAHGSNIINEALLAGVRAFSTRTPDQFGGLADAQLHSVEERESYFHRLAYAQWQLREIRHGEAIEFAVNRMVPEWHRQLVESGDGTAPHSAGDPVVFPANHPALLTLTGGY